MNERERIGVLCMACGVVVAVSLGTTAMLSAVTSPLLAVVGGSLLGGFSALVYGLIAGLGADADVPDSLDA